MVEQGYWIVKANQWWDIIEENNFDAEKILELIVDSGNEIAGLALSQEDPAELLAYAENLIMVWHNIFVRMGNEVWAHVTDTK